MDLSVLNGAHEGKRCLVIGAGPSVMLEDISVFKNDITIAVNSGFVAAKWSKYFVSDDW